MADSIAAIKAAAGGGAKPKAPAKAPAKPKAPVKPKPASTKSAAKPAAVKAKPAAVKAKPAKAKDDDEDSVGFDGGGGASDDDSVHTSDREFVKADDESMSESEYSSDASQPYEPDDKPIIPPAPRPAPRAAPAQATVQVGAQVGVPVGVKRAREAPTKAPAQAQTDAKRARHESSGESEESEFESSDEGEDEGEDDDEDESDTASVAAPAPAPTRTPTSAQTLAPARTPAAATALVASVALSAPPAAAAPAAAKRAVTGNKEVKQHMVPKPPAAAAAGAGAGAARRGKAPKDPRQDFHFEVTVRNPKSLLSFMQGIGGSIGEMRIHLIVKTRKSDGSVIQTGIRFDAHDSALSLILLSRFICALEAGSSPEPGPDGTRALVPLPELHGHPFCVSTKLFTDALSSAMLSGAVVRIRARHANDGVLTFESEAETGESLSEFTIPLIPPENSMLRPLDSTKVETSFHIEVDMKAIYLVCSQAKKAAAADLRFELLTFAEGDTIHMQLVIGFKGNFTGQHRVFTGARRVRRPDGEDQFEAVTDVTLEDRAEFVWVPRCVSRYNAQQVGMFLPRSGADTWGSLDLGKENGSPLVMKVPSGGGSEHIIIIASRSEDDDNMAAPAPGDDIPTTTIGADTSAEVDDE